MNTELTASQASIERKRERLVRDLKSVVADADTLLKDVTNSGSEELAAALSKVEGSLGAVRSRLVDRGRRLTEKAKDAAGSTDQYVKENPWKAMGVAAAAGLVCSYLLRRH